VRTAVEEAETQDALGLYVYGVVDATAEPPEGVTLVRHGAVAALTSRVPLDELDAVSVQARLEDAAWLGARAAAHDGVLGAALRACGAVVPFRMLTVYGDEDELRRFLADNDESLRAVLAGIRDKVELGVKAFADPQRLDEVASAQSPAVASLDAELADVRRIAAELAADAHARLLAVAENGVANRVQSHDASGRPEPMVLNGAYLVPAGDTRLDGVLEELRGGGLVFERTGPWPPYNFVPRDLASA
jgi:hypothetical protein